MPNPVRPSIQAFLVCDYLIRDTGTGKVSVIGTFNQVQAPSFPCHQSQVCLYICITDAEGDYNFEVDLIYIDTERIIGKGKFPLIHVPNRLDINDFGIVLAPVLFPGPGRYEFRLYDDQQHIKSKDFTVVQL